MELQDFKAGDVYRVDFCEHMDGVIIFALSCVMRTSAKQSYLRELTVDHPNFWIGYLDASDEFLIIDEFLISNDALALKILILDKKDHLGWIYLEKEEFSKFTWIKMAGA